MSAAATDSPAATDLLTDPARLAAVWRYSPPGLWGGAEDDPADAPAAAVAVGTADRLVRTAARSLAAPVAVLSVLTDRALGIVAHRGLPAGFAAGGTVPAPAAICPACVAAGRTVSVRDAAADPRFADKMVVTDLGVRGYLGVPVRPDGRHVVAVLCVADAAARDWTGDDVAALGDVAELAAAHLAAYRLAADRRADSDRLRSAADRLRESEARFRDIAESAGEYLWEIDDEARFTFLTPQAEKTFGVPVAEMIGRRPWELYGDEAERERIRVWFGGVMARREGFRDLLRHGHKPDGTSTWVKLSGRPVLTKSGDLRGYRGVGLDVTDQTFAARTVTELAAAADAARRERTDLLERFIRNAPVAVAMFDRDMRYLAHSRRWAEEHGLPAEVSLLARSHYEAFPGQPDRWRAVHGACLAGGTERAENDPFTRADGTAGWLDWQVEPWRDDHGEVGGILILCNDITARQTSLTRLQLAVDAADIGTWLWDLRAETMLADAGLCELFGLPPEAETVGISPDRFYDAIHPEDHAKVAAAVQQAFETGTFDAEYRVRAGDAGADGFGEGDHDAVRWMAGRGRVVRDEEDRPQSFHGAVVDVTARKRTEADLRAATAAAEASDRAKSEFLANMSHELRTPLTAILGFADLIAADSGGGAPSEERSASAADHCRTIRRNGEHLLRLINDVLDLAKVEAGKLTVDRVPVPVRHLLDELTGLMRPKAEGKGLALSVACEDADGAPGWRPGAVLGDPTRLRQILLNLLGNAVKFTAAGSVTLTVRPLAPAGPLSGEDGAAPRLAFVIRDTGPGIGPEDRTRLFLPFEQADAGPTRAAGGTGLGLSISRRLAERLGGTLTVASELGAGSTFTLTVPAEPVPDPTPAAGRPAPAAAPSPSRPDSGPAAPDRPAAGDRGPSAETPGPAAAPAVRDRPLTGRRVLLAEDTEDTRRLITFLLERSGAEVECVENGRLAVDRLAPEPGDGGANDGGAPAPVAGGFDVVLMDMQMPVLDGYSATRELRARGYDGPVVALTAHAMAGDEADCLAAGCDGYATKPVGREELVDHVLRAAAGVRGAAAADRWEPVAY